jgi:hypothetical protein
MSLRVEEINNKEKQTRIAAHSHVTGLGVGQGLLFIYYFIQAINIYTTKHTFLKTH